MLSAARRDAMTTTAINPQDGDALLRRSVGFGRALRDEGLAVGPGEGFHDDWTTRDEKGMRCR